MSIKQPLWGDLSLKRRENQVRRFETVLSSVAKGFAYHANVDVVAASHVDEAYRALARCQLVRVPWYRTPEFTTSFGAMLIGVSFSLATWIGKYFSGSTSVQVITWGIMFSLGCIIWLGGWRCRPTMPHTPEKISKWKCMIPFSPCPHIDVITDHRRR